MAMPELKAKSASQLMEGVGEQASSALGAAKQYPQRMREFFHDVRLEMKHVTWPSRTDVRGTTIVVVVTVFFFGFYFGILDFFFSHAVDYLLRSFK